MSGETGSTRLQTALLSLVAAGFLAWSFAVWRATASVEILAGKLIDIEREVDQHNERPWHAEAGHLIRLQAEQVSRLESTLDRIDHRIIRDYNDDQQ